MRMENKLTKAGGWEGLEGDQDPALGSSGLSEMGLFAWGWCSQSDLGPTVIALLISGAGTIRASSEGLDVPGRASSHSQAQGASPARVRVPGTASTQLG